MTNENKLKLASWLLVYIPIAIGANVMLYFLGKMPDGIFQPTSMDYLITNLSVIIGLFIGHLIVRWRMRGKKEVPIADERTMVLMKNYFLIAIYFIFIVSGIILITLFFMGVETIEIGWIFVYLSSLIILTFIGALIVSRL